MAVKGLTVTIIKGRSRKITHTVPLMSEVEMKGFQVCLFLKVFICKRINIKYYDWRVLRKTDLYIVRTVEL